MEYGLKSASTPLGGKEARASSYLVGALLVVLDVDRTRGTRAETGG